ncbi:MAG: sugar ABC transporter ATP-binding protein [Opitutaceae bacterium]|nr:sugar ABC transporter ATP-binding protein [Opitutaceae bacterium]
MMGSSDIVLEATAITKSFPGVRALDGVSLRVRRGRLLALLGENGAGKSTLMNILSGVFAPDTGTIRLSGQAVEFTSTRAALEAGIGIVFQELNLIPHLSVAENIFLGREPRTRTGLIDYPRLNADAAVILKRLDLQVPPQTLVADLRVGQQQLVEIARAVSLDVKVLILDEPTSSLSAHEVEVLFGVIGEFKRRGVAIIYITHKFEELGRVGDDVTVMRDGRVVGEGTLAELTRDAIVRLMAGREQGEAYQKHVASPTDEILRVENMSVRGGLTGRKMLVDGVSVRVCRGEVVAIFGLVGAGRTELLEAIYGLHSSRTSGLVFMNGRQVSILAPVDAIEAGLALAPEDRKREGLILEMSVLENASLASLPAAVKRGLIRPRREAAHVSPYLDRFRVKTPSLGQKIRNLSGGNQQKVILAKWLAAQPKVLLLDEPTRGIDVNAKREIYAFIDELARSGLGVLVVSSELLEVLAIADTIVVMCEGRRTAEFARRDATAEKILTAALPDRAAVAL